MYCPGCGKENSAEQRFCRSCGLSLLMISQTLAHELAATKSADTPVEIVKREQKRWQSPLLYGFFILVLGLTIIFFGKKVLAEQLVADMGTLISVLGAGLIALKGVFLVLRDSRYLPPPETVPKAVPTTELPHALRSGEPASVTEHTTRQFEPIYSDRKAE